jgi:metallo-beta-lactamase family protein
VKGADLTNRDGATLRFLGAAGTVTGSKHLLEVGGHRLLLDCGLFQGLKALRERNWQPFPFEPASIDAVLLSHAHLDHSGALPLLVRRGFRGPIYCTPGTADLLEVLLLDAAHLQEEEASFANRHRTSKHAPALPLYSVDDAHAALRLLRPQPFGRRFAACKDVGATFHHAGHILGSAIVDLEVGGHAPRRLVFSGDLGRYGRPILRDPEAIANADVILVESTYGDRVHPPQPHQDLAQIVRQGAERGSVILVPAFAVGRTQELLFALRELEGQGAIPPLPVFIDSPMAIDVTEIYARHREEFDETMRRLVASGVYPLRPQKLELLRTTEQSKRLNRERGPMIIISASGMATGGRVLHHLTRLLPDPEAIVLLVGFQAAGTRGRALLEGAKTLRIFGQEIGVRARVVKLDGFSAHADRDELLRWLGGFARPRALYAVHGEAQAADSFAAEVRHRLGWDARAAVDGEVVDLP